MKLGRYQTLCVVKMTDFGIYLAENPNDAEREIGRAHV